MLKLIYLSIISVILSSCGVQIPDFIKVKKKPAFTYRLDGEFTQYYQRFQNVYGIDPTSVSAWFVPKLGTPANEIAGICYVYTNGAKRIEISRKYWDLAGDDGREQLIFHELGHCVLDLRHNEKVLIDPTYGVVPESIMWPYMFGDDDYYSALREYYHEQMKSNK